MDIECLVLVLEDIFILVLWDLLVENVCFESGWVVEWFCSVLFEDCVVCGNFNVFVQVLENLLCNVIWYLLEDGVICLYGWCEGSCWWFCLEDQGEGVVEYQLEIIFCLFIWLFLVCIGKGFGLGLSIVCCVVVFQGGCLWVEVVELGLCLCLVLFFVQ